MPRTEVALQVSWRMTMAAMVVAPSIPEFTEDSDDF